MAFNLKNIKGNLENTIVSAQDGINKFNKVVSESKNLAHTLHWKTEQAMKDSLTIREFKQCLKGIERLEEEGHSEEENAVHILEFQEEVLEDILCKSQSIANKSTSPLANMENELQLEVLTALLKCLKGRNW